MTSKSFFVRWLVYVRDNPDHLWFKRKVFGWGWVPVTWQGWLAVLVLVLYVLFLSFNLNPNSNMLVFFLQVFSGVALLIIICFWKGEKPRWQWGFPENV